MKGLKIAELKEGHIYNDLLSGYRVLVNDVQENTDVIRGSSHKWYSCNASMWNPVSGQHESIIVLDHQLALMPNE